MLQSENVADLSTALAKAQAAMKSAPLNKTNPHFKNKYADLAAIIDATRRPLADNGLSVTQTTELRDGGLILVTTLRHSTGQWVAGEFPISGTTSQQIGSAMTYAKRYSLSSLACIAADEDDDTQAASDMVPSLRISKEQLAQLSALVDKVGANGAKFCKYMKVASLADLPAARFSEAMSELEAKGA